MKTQQKNTQQQRQGKIKGVLIVGIALFLIISILFLVKAFTFTTFCGASLTINSIFTKLISNTAGLTSGEAVFEVCNPLDGLNISKYVSFNFLKSAGKNINNYQLYINYSRLVQSPIYNNTLVKVTNCANQIAVNGTCADSWRIDGGVIGNSNSYVEDFMPIKDVGLINHNYYKIKLTANWEAHLGPQAIDWIPSFLEPISNTTFIQNKWAWFNSSYSNCRNLTLTNNLTGTNVILTYNITGLYFKNISQITIVNSSCNIGGTEVKSTVLQNGSNWAMTTFFANLTGGNTVYSVYYNTSVNKSANLEASPDFCEFNNLCGWQNLTSGGIDNYTIIDFNNSLMQFLDAANSGIYSTKIIPASSVLFKVNNTLRSDDGEGSMFIGLKNDINGGISNLGSYFVSYMAINTVGGSQKEYIYSQNNTGSDTGSTALITNYMLFNSFAYRFISVDNVGTINATIYNSTFGYYGSGSPIIKNLDNYLHLQIGDNGAGNSLIQQIDYIRAYSKESSYFPDNKIPIMNIGNEQFTADVTAPDIIIVYPLNNTNSSNNLLNVNYTTSDNSALSNCWYSNDTFSKNNSLTCGQNITSQIWSDGFHNVRVYANDTLNNVNSSQITFRIDTTQPTIFIIFPINNTNTTNTLLNINYTTSDLNGLSACWYSNDSYSVNTTLTNCANISGATGVTWNEGVHNIRIYANDTSNNINSSQITFRIDTTSPLINILFPISQNYGYNQSINLNYSSIDAGIGQISSCWYRIVNKTGGGIVISNTTLSIISGVCQNSSFNLSSMDNNYNITLYSNDTLGNVNFSIITFGIKTSLPAVILISPANDGWFNNGSNIYFNYTATKDIGIDTCQLYGNWTGVWAVNYTWIKPTNNTMNFTTLNFSDSYNLWNVRCNDTLNNIGWGLNNETFGIDTAFPKISINSLSQVGFTQQIIFNTTINDTNLNSCYYNVFNLAGGLDNTGSFVCNNITTFAVSSYATYNLTVYTNDLANNTAFYNQQFTISSSAPIVQGGGGGGIIINNYPNQTLNISPPRVCISAENAWNKWLDETKGQMLLERIKTGWRILLDLVFCKSSASIEPLDSLYFS